MKSGVTLQQMLTEVKRQSESKEDYLIAPNRLRMESYGKEMFLHLSDDSGTELIEPMTITGIAHRQIGTHLRIPAAYYDRMREERPDLLAYNANTWFKQESSQRMLRTLDGSARAYLSNRYRRIDNIDIAGVTLPILGGLPDIRFESCQITESRMYIKAVNPRLQAEVSPGDIVQAGVIISNSEVGLGSVSIQPLIYPLGILTGELRRRGLEIFLETSGSHPFSGVFDWVWLSPKRRQPPLDDAYGRAHELKVIVESEADFEWAERNAARVGRHCRLYLQPEWSVSERVMPAIVEYVKARPEWNISIQTHKYMRIP